MAIVSFLVYAATIFALPQVRDSRYCCEQSSFAAAFSNIAYGSRIGGMYTGVFDIFIKHFTEPLPQTLEEVQAELPTQPPGRLSKTTLDGNGVGYPLIATAAFRVFGFHWWAPTAVMLILMAASMAGFLRRFPPLLVTLYFSGLTAMLFTILVWDPGLRWQIPVGGIRYFSLVGVLPLFYLMLSLLERQPTRAVAPLALQAAILTLAALTRGNAVTAFGAIAFVGFVRRRSRSVSRELATVGISSAALVIILALVVSPQWVKSGRFHTIVWTRVTQSLGMNPNLPIDDLNKMFPCRKYVPGGIPPGIGDQGGGCIWFAHVIKHKIPIDALWNMTFGSEFEAAMRKAFFRIAFRYPRQTLQTFIYYKPKAVISSISSSLQFKASGDPPFSIALLAAALGVALIAAMTSTESGREITVVSVSALFATTAYLAAYANPATTADLLLFVLIAPGLAVAAAFSAAAKRRNAKSLDLSQAVEVPDRGNDELDLSRSHADKDR